MRRAVVAGILFALAAAGQTPASAHYCVPDNVVLGGFSEHSRPTSPFYLAREGSPAEITFLRVACNHGGLGSTTVNWSTPPGSAAADVDYEDATPSSVTITAPPLEQAQESAERFVDTFGDDQTETLESFSISIDSADPSRIAGKNPAPTYVVDADGAERFTFEPVVGYSQSESQPEAFIPVFRAGPLSATPTSVEYTIEQQSAGSSDYEDVTAGTVTFPANAYAAAIHIRIDNDGILESSETIQLTLSSGGVETTTLTLTILDNTSSLTETTNPRTRFHHPRQGLKYRLNDYRIREMHVFASDNLSGVEEVQMALRKKLRNGSCRWWKSGEFRRGPCNRKVWLKLRKPAYPDGPYYLRAPRLGPSIGTRVRNYTGFARAIDKAGNVEVLMEKGRNVNTFEVARA